MPSNPHPFRLRSRKPSKVKRHAIESQRHMESLEQRLFLAADFNGDGWGDIIWHNFQTGENVAWLMQSMTLKQGASIMNAGPQWDLEAVADLNGNGKADLVFRQDTTGEVVVWFMQGTSFVSSATLPGSGGREWEIFGTGDANKDTQIDLYWHNHRTGENRVWLLNNGTYLGSQKIASLGDVGWMPVGVADFNKDLVPDIVWRNSDTGANSVWYMNTSYQHVGGITLKPLADQAWQLARVEHFTGNTDPDLMWRNDRTGQNIVWELNNGAFVASKALPGLSGGQWSIGGMRDLYADGDFNDDGWSDLFWRDTATGQSRIWTLNDANPAAPKVGQQATWGPALKSPAWELVAVADFDNQRGPDVLWRNNTSGQNIIWLMRGDKVAATVELPWVKSAAFKLVGAADFNGDEFADIVWRDVTTGANYVWLLRGGQKIGDLVLPPQADLNWQIQSVHSLDSQDQAQIFWRNKVTGANEAWLMQGATRLSTTPITTMADQAWELGASRDYDNDGDTDLVWINNATREVQIWHYTGSGYTPVVVPLAAAGGWALVS